MGQGDCRDKQVPSSNFELFVSPQSVEFGGNRVIDGETKNRGSDQSFLELISSIWKIEPKIQGGKQANAFFGVDDVRSFDSQENHPRSEM